MDREVIFRQWHKKRKEFIYHDLNNDESYFLEDGKKIEKRSGNLVSDPKKAINISSLEQYTGLKDKSGKMIFEGDELKINGDSMMDEDGISIYTGMVEWVEEGCGFVLRMNAVNKDKFNANEGIAYPLYRFTGERLEVIGNIHEGVRANENNF